MSEANAVVSVSENYMLCLPDEHITRIHELLENELNKKNGFVYLADKNKVVHKFFKQGNTLISERDDNGKPLVQPVISMSEAVKIKESQRPFKDKMVERMEKDFPEKSKEEIEADADILNEANESIKKLVASGVPPSIAKKIIMSVLDSDKQPTSPEELAELMKQIEEANTQKAEEHKEKED
jgi:hypothetical protein